MNDIVISEVGPRDGLQIHKPFIPTADKVRLVDALSACGLQRIEVTSFVHPKVVPQLADGAEVLARIERRPGVRYAAFVPNVKGAERALACGLQDLKAGYATTHAFNELNWRMSTRDAVQAFRDIAGVARGTGVEVAGVLGTAFGCPYEGRIALDDILRLTGEMIEAGAKLVYFADTTGMADPAGVAQVIEAAQARWPNIRFGLHLHNTRGLGLANALVGLQHGIRDFESSIGGLGGCPYAPLAVGNICTEDFVHMLHQMGETTGIDLDRLIDAARLAETIVGRLPGMVIKAGKATELHDPAVKQDRDPRPAAASA